MMLSPRLQIPRRSRIKSLAIDYYSRTRDNIKQALEGHSRVSLACDTWTSPNHLAFLAVTAYLVDTNWRHRELLIGFEHLDGSHTGEALATAVFKVVQEYDIVERLFAITADNASNNSTMRTCLAAKLAKEGIQWNTRDMSIPCLAHVLQLVVNEIVSSLKVQSPNESVQTAWNERQLGTIGEGVLFSNTIRKVCLAKFYPIIVAMVAIYGNDSQLQYTISRRYRSMANTLQRRR